MKDRNPSRAGKSERQKQALARHIKGIVSDDTSQVDSPFEPSNVAAGAKLPIANSGTRPEGWGRKIEKHLRNNTATYLSVIATIVVGLIITPIFNMNREIGEVRTEYKEMKKNIDDIKANSQDYIKSKDANQTLQDIAQIRSGMEIVKKEVSLISQKVAAIKSYLVNKFSAKLD